MKTYWPPLFAFLRRDGHDPETAKDLVQGFLARLLERQDLASVGPDKGRFRSYLLAGLRNYLVSETRREQALKRGAGAVVSLETEEAGHVLAMTPAPGLSPEAVYDRQWARTVLERALARLQAEHEAPARRETFEVLQPALVGDDHDGYVRLAARLSWTPGAVAVAVHRLRRRLRELVREEVRETVGSAADLEAELRHLLAVWES
ncbi:MAG: sigma-70 family RNA polymerase sigma factor [Verrucomicrobiales bacterium]|nr:sigma-70 family RNA polymerase sigma factor [Verrucomicrobiales bacterium]